MHYEEGCTGVPRRIHRGTDTVRACGMADVFNRAVLTGDKMKTIERTRHPEIKAIETVTQRIELEGSQCYYRTPKAYEIWQEEPLYFLKRIPRTSVLWVIER